MKLFLIAFVLLSVTRFPGSALADTPSSDGYLGFSSGTDEPVLAIRIATPGGRALTKVSWLNNDELSHPEVYIVAAAADAAPNLQGPGVGMQSIVWASEDWSTATLSSSTTSTTGSLWLVLEYPPGEWRSGQGLGGGGGVGYTWDKHGLSAMISDGGSTWTRVHSGIAPSVKVTFGGGPAAMELTPMPLAARTVDESLVLEGDDVTALSVRTELFPARPNPFNPRTELTFALDKRGRVDLSIYDVRGRLVRSLRSEVYPAGSYRVMWDGTSNAGGRSASGVYFARMSTAGRAFVQRLTLIK